MLIDVETRTIGELALEAPSAIAIMERWQIDYCCRGHQSVAEACRNAGVTAVELLAAIGDPRAERSVDWQTRSLADVQDYILSVHHTYTRQAIETISMLSEKVANRHGGGHEEVLAVRRIFAALADELAPHLMKEEQILFPFVEELEAASDGGARPESCFGTIANPIRVMLMEHDTAASRLAELRSATGGYVLPEDACLSFRALYEQLGELERDLHQHMHLENNLLFPRALQLEAYR
ncbi:MAG TPA: iron-sulfur cluster repair di-iron protein [Thermoanaerobaculia bacterium]|nr:iron-sulfur cluster repair di-iron protein [Thermoanaerobaculia bacterium]